MIDNGININPQQYDLYEIYDEASDTEFYVGYSGQGCETAACWRIKKYVTTGTITKTVYPNGSQEFRFAWDKRADYKYK